MQENEFHIRESENNCIDVKKHSSKKILTVVMAAVLLIVLSAIAIVAFCADGDSENHDAVSVSVEDIKSSLSQYGIEKIALPEMFFDESCALSDFTTEKLDPDGVFLTINFEFESAKHAETDEKSVIFGALGIITYDNSLRQLTVPDMDYSNVKQLKVNDIDILVFSSGSKSFITYISNSISYRINLLNCCFETAVNIAESLKESKT